MMCLTINRNLARDRSLLTVLNSRSISLSVKHRWAALWQSRQESILTFPPLDFGIRWCAMFLTMGRLQKGQARVCSVDGCVEGTVGALQFFLDGF